MYIIGNRHIPYLVKRRKGQQRERKREKEEIQTDRGRESLEERERAQINKCAIMLVCVHDLLVCTFPESIII